NAGTFPLSETALVATQIAKARSRSGRSNHFFKTVSLVRRLTITVNISDDLQKLLGHPSSLGNRLSNLSVNNLYTYQGREAAYRGRVFRLGPKVVFKTSDPTVEEWRRLLRVHYADGGMFAAGCTYLEFLDQRFAPNSENEVSARQKELAECGLRGMPRNQAEMRRLLETGGDP